MKLSDSNCIGKIEKKIFGIKKRDERDSWNWSCFGNTI